MTRLEVGKDGTKVIHKTKTSVRYFALNAAQAERLAEAIADDVAQRSVLGEVWAEVPAAMQMEIRDMWARLLKKQVNAFARERMSKRQRGRAFEKPIAKAETPDVMLDFI